jgi:hypothetical protein
MMIRKVRFLQQPVQVFEPLVLLGWGVQEVPLLVLVLAEQEERTLVLPLVVEQVLRKLGQFQFLEAQYLAQKLLCKTKLLEKRKCIEIFSSRVPSYSNGLNIEK